MNARVLKGNSEFSLIAKRQGQFPKNEALLLKLPVGPLRDKRKNPGRELIKD